MKTKDQDFLAEVFNTNEPKPRVRIHLRNLKLSCPKEYKNFVFVVQKLVSILPSEITDNFPISDLDQCIFEI